MMMPSLVANNQPLVDDGEVIYEDNEHDDSIPDIQKITKKNNILTFHQNQKTMNLNSLIYENIVISPYYTHFLQEMSLYQQIHDEIYYKVGHLEPWERGTRKAQGMTGMCGGVRGVGAGGVVSTPYCLMYKLFQIKITRKQLVSMLNSVQSVYLRGMSFLFIRYCQPPSDLWAWFSPYLDDDEEIDPKAGGGDKMTIGAMVRQMLTKLDWYGTLLPRIPVPMQKEIQKKLDEMAAERVREFQRENRTAVERERPREPREREASTSTSATAAATSSAPPAPGPRKTRCSHHLRHHHCLKHRKHCPERKRRERQATKKEAVENANSAEQSSENSQAEPSSTMET